MRIRTVVVCVVCALFALVPAVVSGQQADATITGQVRDTSGGIMPGVTVEVTSAALIERVRSDVTGSDGLYRIVQLGPGEYTITFSLPGFSRMQRTIQLTSGFTATVNAELRVGDLNESITVSAASPVVDIQNVTQRAVIAQTTLEAIPTGRTYGAIGRLIPGIDNVAGNSGSDVGGAFGRDGGKLLIHGSDSGSFKVNINSMPQMTLVSDGSIGVPPTDSLAEEVNVQYSALPADRESGGVFFDLIPKSGGNTFRSSFFGNLSTEAMQNENVSETLKAQGLTSGKDIDYVADINPAIGGPIMRDRLWFFATYREFRPNRFSTMFYDTDKTDFLYTPNASGPRAPARQPQRGLNSRITWQALPRSRFTVAPEVSKLETTNFQVGNNAGTIKAPEATPNIVIRQNVLQLGWTSPITSRLFVEVGGQVFRVNWVGEPQKDIAVAPAAQELSTGIQFRSALSLTSQGYSSRRTFHDYFRSAVTYTTGAHTIKVGADVWHGGMTTSTRSEGYGSYTLRLLNGSPNGVVYRVDPQIFEDRFLKGAFYAQAQSSLRRLTVNYGVRIDTIDSGHPATDEPPTDYFGPRSFEAGKVMRWRDVSPRFGIAYDLFGNGKTAIKASASRYVNFDALGNASGANPAATSGPNLQRTWNDNLVCPTCIPGDFVPQGDPTNPLVNGEIGPSPNANWGTANLTVRYDPAWALGGWGVRDFNWEYSVGVQQELRSNVSLNVAYFDRTFGNFSITDNAATRASDYDSFCINGPVDARLPGGGGERVCGLFDVKPDFVSRVDNVTTKASNYGDIEQNFRGVDVSMNLRLSRALLQGGLAAGRELLDFCGVIAAVPERLISGSTKVPAALCRQVQPVLIQVKLLGSLTLPWALNFAATYQNSYNAATANSNIAVGAPRMGLSAAYVATNALIAPELGRNLSAGSNANASINVVTPGTLWGDRLQQVDLRLSRTFRTGRATIRPMLDLYNLMNANTTTLYNGNYGTNGAAWNLPTSILPARMLKLGVQIDY